MPVRGPSLSSPQLLAHAFSEFISASSQLESSYRDLQQEVSHLNAELGKRNAALTRSLAENDRMREALEEILNSMPCGVLVADSAGAIAMVNPEGRRLLNLANAPVQNLHDLSRLGQVDFEALAEVRGGELEREICIRSHSGTRWLAIGHRKLGTDPLPALAGERHVPLHSIWIVRDITSHKHAEQEREAARRATVQAEIAAILAHEIRNPLASMELFADLIENDRENAAQWISHLRAGIRTLSGTVNNVLSLNGEGTPRLGAIDPAACIQRAVDFAQPIADQAGVLLRFTVADFRSLIHANEDAIRQIILNLVRNAVRHTAAGGSVLVSARAESASVIVEIADTGCGIPDEVVGHIFEAGFSTTGETPGLGLAVCQRMMRQHGGDIRVSSRVNQGTVFQLEFPIAC